MGLGSLLGLSPATTRILQRYGCRSGVLLNGTGTGTTVAIQASATHEFENPADQTRVVERVKACSGNSADGNLYVTAFSGERQPIIMHTTKGKDVKLSLTGKVHTFNRYDPIDVTLNVIGNSLDDYKLTMLAHEFKPVMAEDVQMMVDMIVCPSAAPGYKIQLYNGVIIDFDPGFGFNTNSKITDKAFKFRFAKISTPSWSEEKYEPNASAGLLADLTGIEIH